MTKGYEVHNASRRGRALQVLLHAEKVNFSLNFLPSFLLLTSILNLPFMPSPDFPLSVSLVTKTVIII